jgi:C_GCAxxG_C_C family probable redox protein
MNTQAVKEKNVMKKFDLVLHRLKTGYSCSQSVFSVFADDLGLDREISLKVSSAFGGGIAGMGETCGAVTGVLMALGLKYGSAVASRKHEEEEINKYAETFLARMKAEAGTVACRDILGVDLGMPGALKTAEEKGLFIKKCPSFIKLTVEMAGDLLSE